MNKKGLTAAPSPIISPIFFHHLHPGPLQAEVEDQELEALEEELKQLEELRSKGYTMVIPWLYP